MKVIIDRVCFLELLDGVLGVIASNRSMPLLTNVFLKATKDGVLEAYGTDLEVTVRKKAKAKVLKEGVCLVESKKLYLFIKELSYENVELESKKNNWLKIVCGSANANMAEALGTDYPYKKEMVLDRENCLKIDCQILKDMIEKTAFSISNDETRYHLNGILFQKDKTNSGYRYRMVSTDGHRLSMVERVEGDANDEVVEKDNGVIIPKKGIYEIKKILDSTDKETVSIHIVQNELVLEADNTQILARLIDGTFPDYRQFMPENFENKVMMSRPKLVSSLRGVSVLADERSRSVTFDLKKEKLEIISNDSEKGDAKERLDVENAGTEEAGQDIKIGFNAKYLLDVLNSFDEDRVRFEFKDEISPGVIKPELDKDFTCVVMPMRLDSPLKSKFASHTNR